MITISFILARVRLVLALLPLLTVRKIANLVAAICRFIVRSETTVAHPPILILTLTTECNYSCIMCLRSRREGSTKGSLMAYDNPREMDFDRLEALLREHADYLCVVQLHGGEPLTYSRFLPLVQLLNELRIPFDMVTNGSLLSERLCTELVGRYCFGLSVSLDAASPGTYARIRKGGDLANVLEGVGRITGQKRERRVRRPVVSASMCVFAQNVNEMAGLVRLCSDHGISDLTINEGWDYDTPEISEEHLVANNIDPVRRALEAARAEARRRKVNLRIRFPSLSGVEFHDVPRQDELMLPRNCLNLYASAWVLPDFRLMGCSNATAAFGSLTEYTFEEVWNGKAFGYVRARRSLKRKEVPAECTGCIYTGSFFS